MQRTAAALVVVVTAATGLSGGVAATASAQSTAVATGLGVEGTALTLNGSAFMPRGFSFIAAMAGPTCPTATTAPDLAAAVPHLGPAEFAALHDGWHANTVRFQVSQTELTGSSADVNTYITALQQDVAQAHQAGLEVVLSMNDLPLSCGPSHHLPSQATVAAWQVLGPAFASDADVMLELFNEPLVGTGSPTSLQPLPDASWVQWRLGGTTPDANGGDPAVGEQTLVDELRGLHVNNVLLADGLNRAGILPSPHQGQLLSDQLGQLAYAVHPYFYTSPNGTADWDYRFGDTSSLAPVVATEWNYTTAECGTAAQTLAPALLDYLSAHGVGVLGFAADNGIPPSVAPHTLMADWSWDPSACATTPGAGPGFDFQHYLAVTTSLRASALTLSVPPVGSAGVAVAGTGSLTIGGVAAPSGLTVSISRHDSAGTTVLAPVVVGAGGAYAFSDIPSRGTTTYTAGYAGNAVTAAATSAPAAVVVPALPTYAVVAQCRAFDTRGHSALCSGAVAVPSVTVKAGATVTVQVTGVGGVPAGATAVVINLTAVGATRTTYVDAFATGSPRPAVSNLNVSGAAAVAGLAVVPIGAGGRISLFNHAGSVNLVGDIDGYFAVGAGGGSATVTPCRAFDTRGSAVLCAGSAATPVARIGPGGVLTVKVAGVGGIPADATAVVVNLTAVGASAATVVTAYPAGGPRPGASTLNVASSAAVSNLAVVAVGAGGAISLYNLAGTVSLVGDIAGAFTPASGDGYVAVTPCRAFDTRAISTLCPGATNHPAARLAAGGTVVVQIAGVGGVPAGATAVVLTLTAVGAPGPTFITAYPTGSARPVVSNLNVSTGAALSNLAVVPLGAGGSITLANGSAAVNVLGDIAGYLMP